MSYSRSSPSARHQEMIELYRRMHREGETQRGLAPEDTYPGASLLPHARRVKELIDKTGARTVLDYGCGKGRQYDPRTLRVPGVGEWESVIDYWDIDEVCCYDPCFERYSKLPQGTFDGVISTDVLEHCVEDDISWIIAEMFSYANRFVFSTVACYPSTATLPNGENAHCTVRPLAWWQPLFAAAAAQYPGVAWSLVIVQQDPDGRGMSTITTGG